MISRIGFYGGPITLRGTHIALFDYAFFNQTLLGNESLVFHDDSAGDHNSPVLEKFRQHFELIPYERLNDLSKLAERNAVDAMYIIKSGEIDTQIVDSVPNLIHAVFPQQVSQIHGDTYAFVSEWLSKECSNHKVPYVPHMISLPKWDEDLRKQLGIPRQSVVFGCYGGSDSFNLKFVQETVRTVVSEAPHIHFLFMNISPFATHKRTIFLPGNSDMEFKVRFINTCDAMIHARGIGESFGLACGEFSSRNKPIITYALSPQRSHLDILGPKALTYKGPKELKRIFVEFDGRWAASQDWDCYSDKFSPEAVMTQFDSVFLRGHYKSSAIKDTITIGDRCAIGYYRARKKLRSLSRKLYL